jgi:tetratricopeptide (TPR) repeat protein
LNGESKELKSGTFIYEDYEGNVPYGHMFFDDEVELKIELRKLDSLYQATKDLDYLSDKGIVLILLGQYEKAIELYLDIEKIKPKRYSTASNIGTAYELIGQNENALKWINRSIEIDSASHNNSEWIHARILEAKIKGEQLYTTTHLLKTNFGTGESPISKLTKDELSKLHSALYFQLNERISFIKPKDKIVAQLLFDLGNIAYLVGQYSDALEDYRLAKEYGFAGQLIENRIKSSIRVSKDNSYFIEILIGAVSIIAIGLIVYKRKTRKNK